MAKKSKKIWFQKLQWQLEDKWHSAESAWNIAYSIGKKKYGAEWMAAKSRKARLKK